MHYELYLDVYFVENLLINVLILRLTGKLAGRRTRWWRRAGAALFGALAACAVVVSPLHRNRILSAAVSAAAGFLMVRLCFAQARLFPSLCLAAALLGAVWQLLQRLTGTFWMAILPGYAIACAGMWILRHMRRRDTYLYEVDLCREMRHVHVVGLLDSGNHLRQPGSGRPVQIMEYGAICSLLSEAEQRELTGFLNMEPSDEPSGKFSYIPYRSIGVPEGILPVMELEQMQIRHGDQTWSTEEILTAVTKTALSGRGEYQMILYPEILE